MAMQWKYKKELSFERREAEGRKMREKYPDRVPVIVERLPKTSLPDLPQQKLLVPNDLTVGQLHFLIRKRLTLRPDETLYFFVDNTVPAVNTLMSQLYSEHHDADSFLYVAYSSENTMG